MRSPDARGGRGLLPRPRGASVLRRACAPSCPRAPASPWCSSATNAIAGLREIMGATDPAKAAAGTIRKDFAASIESERHPRLGRAGDRGASRSATSSRASSCPESAPRAVLALAAGRRVDGPDLRRLHGLVLVRPDVALPGPPPALARSPASRSPAVDLAVLRDPEGGAPHRVRRAGRALVAGPAAAGAARPPSLDLAAGRPRPRSPARCGPPPTSSTSPSPPPGRHRRGTCCSTRREPGSASSCCGASASWRRWW